MSEKFTQAIKMKIPKHCYWIKTKAWEITEDIKRLGAKILKEDELTLDIEAPDCWYFTTDNQRYLTVFLDKERTKPVFTIKERINTGTLETHIVQK